MQNISINSEFYWTDCPREGDGFWLNGIGEQSDFIGVFIFFKLLCNGFPGDSVVNNPPANARGVCSIPRSGRSPGEGNGYATIHGVNKEFRHNLATKQL